MIDYFVAQLSKDVRKGDPKMPKCNMFWKVLKVSPSKWTSSSSTTLASLDSLARSLIAKRCCIWTGCWKLLNLLYTIPCERLPHLKQNIKIRFRHKLDLLIVEHLYASRRLPLGTRRIG